MSGNSHSEKNNASVPTSAAVIHNHRRIPFSYLKIEEKFQMKVFLRQTIAKQTTQIHFWTRCSVRRKYCLFTSSRRY